ncbi:immunoglobulin-like domain-containing protein [Virgibacillus doumboii]|uniref:immunoglobulin-like domain-containing protein n=1 Tax=Virgibacillus doumboii TaxID=2697503 RepID=UPI0013DFCEDB|nr:immunoglobulin-like domain-containing protein [Virgibacillus doumboii]
MKRCLSFLFCLAIGLTLLAGCGGNGNSAETTDWEPTIYETVNNFDGVTMIVKKETVSSTGLTVTFKNTSDKQYTYGDPFLLEKKIKGSWYQVPIALDDNYGFNDIGYDLAPSDVSEWTVDWDWLYGNLKTGEYRIVKDVLDVKKPGDYDTHHLAAKFTID